MKEALLTFTRALVVLALMFIVPILLGVVMFTTSYVVARYRDWLFG